MTRHLIVADGSRTTHINLGLLKVLCPGLYKDLLLGSKKLTKSQLEDLDWVIDDQDLGQIEFKFDARTYYAYYALFKFLETGGILRCYTMYDIKKSIWGVVEKMFRKYNIPGLTHQYNILKRYRGYTRHLLYPEFTDEWILKARSELKRNPVYSDLIIRDTNTGEYFHCYYDLVVKQAPDLLPREDMWYKKRLHDKDGEIEHYGQVDVSMFDLFEGHEGDAESPSDAVIERSLLKYFMNYIYKDNINLNNAQPIELVELYKIGYKYQASYLTFQAGAKMIELAGDDPELGQQFQDMLSDLQNLPASHTEFIDELHEVIHAIE